MDYSKSHDFKMPIPDDYKYIWAWGKMFGSMDYYIDRQIKKAREGNAPLDALYYDNTENKWHTVGDVASPTRAVIEHIINERGM